MGRGGVRGQSGHWTQSTVLSLAQEQGLQAGTSRDGLSGLSPEVAKMGSGTGGCGKGRALPVKENLQKEQRF